MTKEKSNLRQNKVLPNLEKALELFRLSPLEGPGERCLRRQPVLSDELLAQLHRGLPLLLGRLPAQPHPDAEGAGGHEEGVVGVEVVLRQISLLHLLRLHLSSHVTHPERCKIVTSDKSEWITGGSVYLLDPGGA